MPTTPSSARAGGGAVAVDVTAHKEAVRVTDTKKQAQRVRYYVEVVVGNPRSAHTRLQFSGPFSALLALHHTFERLWVAAHGVSNQDDADGNEHTRPSTIPQRSSTGSVGRPSKGLRGFVKRLLHKHESHQRASMSAVNAPSPVPEVNARIVPFPCSSANRLLVRLEMNEAGNDDKIAQRTQALFGYYNQLFRSDDGALFLDYVRQQSVSEEEARRQALTQTEEQADSNGNAFTLGLRKLFQRQQHEDLEFVAPVHVGGSGKIKHRR